MRIIGFNLTRISIEKKEKQPGKLKITQNIDIKDLIKEKIPISEKESIRIRFKFDVDYSEDFAKLEFDGNVILLPDEDEVKKIMDSWKDKKVPENIRIPLFNFIMGKCNVKALSLEDEMGLPLHIPMPKLRPGKQG